MPATEHEGHDEAVRFLDEDLAGDQVDASRWDWWTGTDGGLVHYYAKGPCPKCGAPGQHGKFIDAPAPIESQGREIVVAPEPQVRSFSTIEVVVSCECGHEHGQKGARGCGRRWSIREESVQAKE